jgi:ApaG protein
MIGTTTGMPLRDGLYAWQVMSNEIIVQVTPEFLPHRSRADQQFFVYAYHVLITNLGTEAVQLLRRKWVITDGTGHVEQVEGDGVVGEQPWLEPGQSFAYESACPLRTPTGNMRGWYYFKTKHGQSLKARIPLFFLRPNIVRKLQTMQ